MLLDERTIRINVRSSVSDAAALRIVERVSVLMAVAAAFIEGDLDAFAPGARPIRVDVE
jgi:hypothetical protein